MEAASVIVVIIGDAISAGSTFRLLASIGRRQPSDLAISIVHTSVEQTTAAMPLS